MTVSTQDRRYPKFTIGWRFRIARYQLADMDAKTFADLIGVSRNTVRAYEDERVTPRNIVVNAWALATGVDPEWLRTGQYPDPDVPEQDPGLQPTVQYPIRSSAA